MANYLPFSTPYDPTEDPPGSQDPLGTLAEAERLADILLPGFTARMWKPRLLTFAAVASVIADRVVKLTGKEQVRLEARLVFERLFVAAVVHQTEVDPEGFRYASVRLPGRNLAERARREWEPLRAGNFLKGQAVNGPYGVMARLARAIGLIDGDGRSGRNAPELLLAWSDDQGLPDFLEDPNQAEGEGVAWAEKMVKSVSSGIGKQGDWPRRNSQFWEMLAGKIRPDRLVGRERKTLIRALESEPIRRRTFELLRTPISVEAYRAAIDQSSLRGVLERNVLLKAIAPQLRVDEPTDALISACLDAIDAYELASGVLQQIFDAIIWGLCRRSGRAKQEDILGMKIVSKSIEKAVAAAESTTRRLEKAAGAMKEQHLPEALIRAQALEQIRDDVTLCRQSVPDAVSAVLARHEKVQRAKRKATWIDCGPVWMLMPGYGTDADKPTEYRNIFLHPMRVVNAYAFLRELGLSRLPTMSSGDDN